MNVLENTETKENEIVNPKLQDILKNLDWLSKGELSIVKKEVIKLEQDTKKKERDTEAKLVMRMLKGSDWFSLGVTSALTYYMITYYPKKMWDVLSSYIPSKDKHTKVKK